jgi:ComF family protein
MRQLLTVGLDLLFPPTAQELLVRHTKSKTVLDTYHPASFKQIIYLSQYADPLVQALLIQNKFHHSASAARYLGILLSRWHHNQPSNTMYLPIPLGKQRLRSRGHNQVLSILQAAKLREITHTNVLFRRTETEAQSNLDRSTRLKNIQGAFMVNLQQIESLQGKNIVLLDDVVTTGATLETAKQALLPHLPPTSRLTLLALAH